MSVGIVKICNTGSSLGLRIAAHCPVAWLGSGAFSPYQFIKLARAGGEPRDRAIFVPLDLKSLNCGQPSMMRLVLAC
jgi:hypothetical protein